MYIFIIFFLIFLLDFIVTINIIQLLAAILIRINYLSIKTQYFVTCIFGSLKPGSNGDDS